MDAAKNGLSLGSFKVQTARDGPLVPAEILGTKLGVCCVFSTGEAITFRAGFMHQGGVILVGEDRKLVRVTGTDPKAVFQAITPLADGFQNEDGSYSALVFDLQNFDWPIELTITAEEVIVGDVKRLALETEGDVSFSVVTADVFRFLTFCLPDNHITPELKIYVPPDAGGAVCLEWDTRRIRRQVAKANITELYKMYNETRKHELLVTLFLDVLLLENKLNGCDLDDYPIDELVEYIEDRGEVEVSNNKEMQAAMITRIVLLTLMLPEIKQNAEVLATMYPYYWLHHEERWLQDAFGVDPKSKFVQGERSRLTPIIRREVRAAQATNQRALAEMEAAARSLDAVLARQETHDHWQAKVRKFVPMGLQGVFAGGMIVFSGGTNPAAWNMLGNFLASGVLGNLCGVMLQDMEAMTQIRRVAKTLFPWWRVFMTTSVVAIYEAAQFIDAQNIASMQRDRALLAQVKEPERAAAIDRLQKALRERIVATKLRIRTEKVADNSVSLSMIVDDIDFALETKINWVTEAFIRPAAAQQHLTVKVDIPLDPPSHDA